MEPEAVWADIRMSQRHYTGISLKIIRYTCFYRLIMMEDTVQYSIEKLRAPRDSWAIAHDELRLTTHED